MALLLFAAAWSGSASKTYSTTFSNAVTLSATGQPAGATVAFNPASVTPGASGQSSTMTVTVPKSTASLRSFANNQIFLALLVLPLMLVGRRSSHLRLLHLLLIVLVYRLSALMAAAYAAAEAKSETSGTTNRVHDYD